MLVIQATRKFEFFIKGQSVPMDDPNPDWSPERVKDFYGNQYPELLNATLEGPAIRDDEYWYTARVSMGTKG